MTHDCPRRLDAYSFFCGVGVRSADFRRHFLGATLVVVASVGNTVFQGP